MVYVTPSGAAGKESTCQWRRCGFSPWVGKIPWSRKWLLTPVFLSGKSHGQRSLVGAHPWGRKELDTAKCIHTHPHTLSLSLSHGLIVINHLDQIPGTCWAFSKLYRQQQHPHHHHHHQKTICLDFTNRDFHGALIYNSLPAIQRYASWVGGSNHL